MKRRESNVKFLFFISAASCITKLCSRVYVYSSCIHITHQVTSQWTEIYLTNSYVVHNLSNTTTIWLNELEYNKNEIKSEWKKYIQRLNLKRNAERRNRRKKNAKNERKKGTTNATTPGKKTSCLNKLRTRQLSTCFKTEESCYWVRWLVGQRHNWCGTEHMFCYWWNAENWRILSKIDKYHSIGGVANNRMV